MLTNKIDSYRSMHAVRGNGSIGKSVFACYLDLQSCLLFGTAIVTFIFFSIHIKKTRLTKVVSMIVRMLTV